MCRVVGRSNYNANANGGVAYANANNASSNSNTNNGSRLANRKRNISGQSLPDRHRFYGRPLRVGGQLRARDLSLSKSGIMSEN